MISARSLERLVLVLSAAFGVVLALGALGAGFGAVAADDPDVWWVGAAGRLGSLGAPLVTNTFSFTAPEAPWVFHEHLAAPLYARGLETFGTSFLSALALVGLVTTAALVLYAAVLWRAPTPGERLAGLVLALAWCVAVGLHGMNARVTIVARLLPLAFVLLSFDSRLRRRQAVTLVGLMLVWANLHGSFPLGVVILVAAGLEGERRARWTIAALCALASFLTPHGIALHGLVVDYLVGDADTLRVVHEYVREFQPLYAVDPTAIVPELLALVLVATLALLGLRTHSARALLVLFLVLLATRNQRHLPLALMLAVPLMRPVLAAWLPVGVSLRAKPTLALALAPALVLGPLAWLRSPAPSPRGGGELEALVARLPDGARVFAPVDLGGRIAWLAYPRVRVFADPRNDCYPADVLGEAYELSRPGQDPQWIRDTLADRGATHVIDRAGSSVAHALDAWEFVRREGPWVLLAAPSATAMLSSRGARTSAPRARRVRR